MQETWGSSHHQTLAARPRAERLQLEQRDRRHVRPEFVEPGLVRYLPKKPSKAVNQRVEAYRISDERDSARPRECERQPRPNRADDRLPRTGVGDEGRLGRARRNWGRRIRSAVYRCVKSRKVRYPPFDLFWRTSPRRFRATVATRSHPSQSAHVRNLEEAERARMSPCSGVKLAFEAPQNRKQLAATAARDETE